MFQSVEPASSMLYGYIGAVKNASPGRRARISCLCNVLVVAVVRTVLASRVYAMAGHLPSVCDRLVVLGTYTTVQLCFTLQDKADSGYNHRALHVVAEEEAAANHPVHLRKHGLRQATTVQ